MKALAALGITILIIWLFCKIYSWDEKKNDGCGCGFITIIATILIFVFSAISTCKSCISDSGKNPSHDYYDDRVR